MAHTVKELVVTSNTIRVLRTMRGWSQRQLAHATGLMLQRVWKLENGVSSPRGDEAVRIPSVLSADKP